jgi:hypothetical protein
MGSEEAIYGTSLISAHVRVIGVSMLASEAIPGLDDRVGCSIGSSSSAAGTFPLACLLRHPQLDLVLELRKKILRLLA